MKEVKEDEEVNGVKEVLEDKNDGNGSENEKMDEQDITKSK